MNRSILWGNMGYQSQNNQASNDSKTTQAAFGLEGDLMTPGQVGLFQGGRAIELNLKRVKAEEEGIEGDPTEDIAQHGFNEFPVHFETTPSSYNLGLGASEFQALHDHEDDDHLDGLHDHEVDDHLDGLPGVDIALIEATTGIFESDLPTQGGTFDLAQTFSLNSNVGAAHTIYLDFNGHTTTDFAWTQSNGGNAIVTSAYDFDGNTSGFSTSELTRIQYIWQRVAEDFSPFNLNVTTEDPGIEALRRSGTGDAQWGVRVVIGAGTWFGNAGGVAYISSFNSSSDQPAFVFENNLGNGNEKYTAEAISHEAAHTLGLSHDGQGTTEYYQGHGSGVTGYAPILGNSYYQNLTQFSRGEYSGASNRQDDLAIITGNNGFGYRADDHGNTLQSATRLTANFTALNASGIIERNTDFDTFSFYTGAGSVSLNLNTAPRGANLDILANLYDASGGLVASSNPLNVLNASFNLGLAAGQYFLEVTGTGQGDPLNGGYSDYGSLGQYTLTGSIVDPGGDFLEISPLNADQSEGNSGNRVFSFVVNRSGNTTGATSVQYEVSGVGSDAASASDFSNGVLPTGTVQFAANETSKVIEIAINGDAEVEADEHFRVSLVHPSATTTLITTSAEGVIRNDDTPPALPIVSIGPATLIQNEGNSGTTAYQFTVSLNSASSNPVTVNFQTNDGSATVANGDYIDNDGSLVFNPGGALSQTITVLANGDTLVEANETFTVQLTGATNAQVGNGLATGTITNDEVPVTVAPANFVISDVVISEATGLARFTVSRSGNTDSMASVNFTTVNGSGKSGAKSGSDFIAAQNSLTFSAGETSRAIEIALVNDSSQERDEVFYVDLQNASSNATILDARGRASILNDDGVSRSTNAGTDWKSGAPSVIGLVDSILGVDASETIVGAQTGIEMQRGTRGQDVFALGNEQGVFYGEAGDQDFALISGLNARQDKIQLHGSVEDYQLSRGAGERAGLSLVYGEGAEQDLIAVISGNSALKLASSTFQFV